MLQPFARHTTPETAQPATKMYRTIQEMEEANYRPESEYSMVSTEFRLALSQDNADTAHHIARQVAKGRIVYAYDAPATNNFDAIDGERTMFDSYEDAAEFAERVKEFKEMDEEAQHYHYWSEGANFRMFGSTEVEGTYANGREVIAFVAGLKFRYTGGKVSNPSRFALKVCEAGEIDLSFWEPQV